MVQIKISSTLNEVNKMNWFSTKMKLKTSDSCGESESERRCKMG